MSIMNITIMNRYSAIQYCENQHEQKSAIISISTPYGEYINDPPFVSPTNNVQDILYLSFADADAPNTLDYLIARVIFLICGATKKY